VPPVLVKENKAEAKKPDTAKVIVSQKPAVDSSLLAKKVPELKTMFIYAPEKPHAVALLMIKVDPVYVTETRNAFNRYNQETYYNKTIEINNVAINDSIKLVVISGFENASTALDYMDKAKKLAPREIIPWLPENKYSFLVITEQNLDILKTNKDAAAYRKFLQAYFPGKF